MHLKRLDLYGFKSFADRTEFHFHNGITGIVGPNGSGKSNIADAVRWVLGEQSARTLRGNRMEDIIFSGTDRRKPLGFCEVSLLFDNTDNALPVDFAEVAVTRRVFRNGESEYALNKTPCRLKDIVDLFRDTGIGKEGYSLIGQGRIDEILSARSEDRRQVFEEAVGIVRYRARKEEAEKRIETMRQNMVRIGDIIEEIDRQLGPLREQAEDAKRYLALMGEQRALDLRLFLHESGRVAERQALMAERVEEIGRLRAQLEERLEAAVSERSKEREALDTLEERLVRLREEKNRATREFDAASAQKQLIQERRAGVMRELARLEGELARASEAKRGMEDGGSAEDLAARRAELDTIRERHREAEERASAQAEAMALREETLEQLKALRIEALDRAADRKANAARLEAMRESLERRLAEVTSQLADAREAMDRLDLSEREASSLLQSARDDLARIQERRAAAQKQNNEEASRIEKLAAHRSALEGNARELASRERMLADMARDYEGYQSSVRTVMKYVRQKSLPGVHGVVAELLSVPRELETAIDMALGAGMQNIIVEREENAKELIEFLRSGRAGRATFLPLSALRPRVLTSVEREVLSMPGCLGVASELVAYDAQYRGAVENLLGRTVIAEDLDRGIGIMRKARHAFRLVTLSGDVMHSGGSMTGGSQQSRATGLLSRERELLEVRSEIERNKKQAERAGEEYGQAVAGRARIKEKVAALFEEERQAEIACAREAERLQKARESGDAHGKRVRGVEEEIAVLTGQIEDIAEEAKASRHGTLSEEVSQEDLLAAIAGQQEQLSQARASVERAREEATAIRILAAETARELESADRDARRLRDELASLEKRSHALAGEMEAARQNAARQDQEILAAELQAKEAERLMRTFSDELDAVEDERVKAMRRERESSERAQEYTTEQAALKDREMRIELQRERLEAELHILSERIWNEYEVTLAGARDEVQSAGETGFEVRAASARVAEIRAEVRALGLVNVNAVEECAAVSERHEQLVRQREDLQKAEIDLLSIIEDLTKRMRAQFIEGMAQLNQHFDRLFARLFRGGGAQLILQDESDPLTSGIEIAAQLPGKKTQLLSLLSGGERALTAIAILFAMLCVKPTPFCILDEIEAALDEANIVTFADVLSEFAQETQFIVVTHRKGTMERCDGLYGISMEEKGVSRLMSVRLAEVS